eukprot:m51a1_g1399 hypothetical protein (166) ;mRNA; r:489772-491431
MSAARTSIALPTCLRDDVHRRVGRAAVEEESARRIEFLEAALCASDQRRREAEEESRRARIFQLVAELDGAVTQIAALTDRLRDMICLESFNEVTRRRTPYLLVEVEAQGASDAAASRARIAELEPAARCYPAAVDDGGHLIAELTGELARARGTLDAAETARGA